MSSGSKRKLYESQLSKNSSNTSPPFKKAKHNQDEEIEDQDQMKIVMIGNDRKPFSCKLLSNVPYFEARLSEKWNNTKNDNIIRISLEDPFIFSIKDLCSLLSCLFQFNNFDDTFIIPSHLLPQTTFLSFMQCANFFCVNRMMDEEILMNYYDHPDVAIIGIDTLMKWKASNIPQIVQFASKMLINRQNMTLQRIAKSLNKCKRHLTWYKNVQISARKSQCVAKQCNESVIKQFDCAIALLIENCDNDCDLNNVITELKGCISRIKKELSFISSLSQSNQGNEVLSLLLKLLSHFTKYDKHFKVIHEAIISLMIVFCAYYKVNQFDSKVKALWGEIVVYIFKTVSDQQLMANIIDRTLCIFVDDEKRMEEIFEVVNNNNGQQLALGIMEYDLVDGGSQSQIMLQQKYSSFCSKFFNPIKLNTK